jgi:signal transduction histidine kinase
VEFRSTGIDELKLDYETKINLYRIAQERLNNIKKYSDAKHVRVKMMSSFPNIILLIENDGEGFDINKELSPGSGKKRIGIQNLQERVTLLKGEMEVDSSPEKGTKILIKIPVE